MFKIKLYGLIYKLTLMLSTLLAYQIIVQEPESLLQAFIVACVAYTISSIAEHFYQKSLCENAIKASYEENTNTKGDIQ